MVSYLPPRDRRPVGIPFAMRTYALSRLLAAGFRGPEAASAAAQLVEHMDRAARDQEGPRLIIITPAGNLSPVSGDHLHDLSLYGPTGTWFDAAHAARFVRARLGEVLQERAP
jgi:hypothetical protein